MGSSGDLPVVEVLLATYNGERFLREQIDSILNQDYANLRILARDDGSSDGTVAILSEYQERFSDRFHMMPASEKTGSAKLNFLLLMKASTADYICFSDQDDVWLPDKVSKTKQAIDRLEARWGADVPLLAFSDLRVVDDALQTLHESFWQQGGIDPERIGRLSTLLGQNVLTGCTAMINRPLLNVALDMPEEAPMHDHWIALIAAAFGALEVVRAKTVLYRQHDRNVVGVTEPENSLQDLVRRFFEPRKRMLQWHINQNQAKALLQIHGEQLSAENREVLEAYLLCGRSSSRMTRVATVIRYGFFRKGLLRNLATILDLWRMRIE